MPFAKGAMRSAFRMKMMSTHTSAWSPYVAKEYISKSSVQDIKNDVVMQTESKILAEAFNRLHPPKRVDFLEGW